VIHCIQQAKTSSFWIRWEATRLGSSVEIDNPRAASPAESHSVLDKIDPPKKTICLFQIARTPRFADGDNVQAASPAVVFTDVVTRLVEKGLEANLVGLMKSHLTAKPPPSLVSGTVFKVLRIGVPVLAKVA
jgi:hypothetical protein